MNIHPTIVNAYNVLDGDEISETDALALAELRGNDILDMVSLANKVRDKYAAAIVPCSIINAKSGVCSQNCSFCAQAGCHQTGVDVYPLLPSKAILASAREAYKSGVRSFGIVTSGLGYLAADDEFCRLLAVMDMLRKELPELKICLSLGILSESTAALLAEHGAWRYNMNLQTNPARYAELIANSHSIVDRIQTIRYLQKYGVSICCGGIFGLGESWEDRVKMAIACRDLDVNGIPLNVLLPIKGTPLEDRPLLSAAAVAKGFAIFRLINPRRMIKFAAGRETTMKDFQGLLMLAGMNSMITGGYLTTRGRSVDEDTAFLQQLTRFTDNA